MICAVCSQPFQPAHHAERICSDECRRVRKNASGAKHYARKVSADREAQRERWREAQRKRRAEHPEKTKFAQADWTDRNRERTRDYLRRRRAADPEGERAKQRAWRERNKEWLREYDRKRRAKRKEIAEVATIVGEIVDLLQDQD